MSSACRKSGANHGAPTLSCFYAPKASGLATASHQTGSNLKLRSCIPCPDRLAMGVSVVCTLHCFCIPFLLTISAFTPVVSLLSEPIEYLFLCTSFLLGIGNLSYCSLRRHHRCECLALFAVGFSMLSGRDHLRGSLGTAAGLAGGGLVATAHWRNSRLLRRAECCDGDTHMN